VIQQDHPRILSVLARKFLGAEFGEQKPGMSRDHDRRR
jgi:hypothetical protein